MFITYLKTAFRSLRKNPLFSFINIFGLALGMTICMMVMVRVKDAFSYDRFHPYPERTYRILSQVKNDKGDQFKLASTPLPLRNEIANETAMVESAVNIYPAASDNISYRGKTLRINGAFTEPSFFSVFGFELSAGNKTTALGQPNSIILSSDMAARLFGKENPMGKLVSFEKLGTFTVTGILDSTPVKSHIAYDAFVSAAGIAQLEAAGILPARSADWNSFEYGYTYVLLKEGVKEKNIAGLLAKIAAPMNAGTDKGRVVFELQALDKISPGTELLYHEIGSPQGWTKLLVEIGIGLLILVAACFNYINLTIARALTRAKEVGIRKVAGAMRYQIFLQYTIESLLLALLALLLATGMLSLILQYKPFNDGYQFMPDVQLDAGIFMAFLVFALLTGLLAGAAPAWILSAFKPVSVLKNISTTKLFGNISLQKSLIVFQFTLSLTVIIFLSVFYKQFSYMGKGEYGFRKEHIVTVPLEGADPNTLVNEIRRINGVEAVSCGSGNPGRNAAGAVTAATDKTMQNGITLDYFFADAAFLPVMDIPVVTGENLPGAEEGQAEKYILLNEKAVTAFRFINNSDAIGKTIWINDSTGLIVKGIVRNFYYAGIPRSVQPMAVRNKKEGYTNLNILLNTTDEERVMKQVAAVYKDIEPFRSFSYTVLSKQLRLYNDQSATISLLGFLAFMTVFIASFGLLGLVIYTVETRRKEISIRKVIGAGFGQLIILLSKGFVKLLVLSACIAMPIGYAMSFLFLQNFEQRVNIGFGILAICFLFILVIGLSAIISQTYKAVMQNPVKNLRTE